MAKRKVGRPSKYTPELAQEICDVVAVTSTSVKRMCKAHPHWPGEDTIFAWINKYPEFSKMYARAKQSQVEKFMDDIIEISDEKHNDSYVNDKGNEVCDGEYIARSRLRVDTRKWLASKLVPRIYGDQRRIDELEAQNDVLRKELLEHREKLKEEYKKDY